VIGGGGRKCRIDSRLQGWDGFFSRSTCVKRFKSSLNAGAARANVGTCGTALLASIGKSAEAAQVGVVHLLFNVLGVLFWVFLIPQLADLVRHISPTAPDLQGTARLAAETPRQVAKNLRSGLSRLVTRKPKVPESRFILMNRR
jgi:hypothetical protein